MNLQFGLGKKKRTTYEEVIEFLESHDGQIMKSHFKDKNKKILKTAEMSQEQREEINLYKRWSNSNEKKY